MMMIIENCISVVASCINFCMNPILSRNCCCKTTSGNEHMISDIDIRLLAAVFSFLLSTLMSELKTFHNN